jgi:hypothetical protein
LESTGADAARVEAGRRRLFYWWTKLMNCWPFDWCLDGAETVHSWTGAAGGRGRSGTGAGIRGDWCTSGLELVYDCTAVGAISGMGLSIG